MEHAAVPGMTREETLEDWVNAYSDCLLKTCFLELGDRALAQDALQDTFFKAWKAMERFERQQVRNVRAWLLRIAINTCRDYRRGAWFRRMDFHQALEELPPGLLALPAEDRSLFLSLAGLPAPEKRLILLYYYHNLTLREAADILGMPKSTAAKRLRRAEEMLRQSLTGGDEP